MRYVQRGRLVPKPKTTDLEVRSSTLLGRASLYLPFYNCCELIKPIRNTSVTLTNNFFLTNICFGCIIF